MGIVYCKIPRAGLGNQLFVISKALYYSEVNKLKIIFYDSKQLKIGPYLRGERSKRNYQGFFEFQKGFLAEILIYFKNRKQINRIRICDPQINEVHAFDVLFSSIPHYSNYFDELIPYRTEVQRIIFNNLTSKIQNQILNLKIIDVAVHIRLGDFQKLARDADFKQVGSTRTPLSFFIEEVNKICKQNPNYKFHIFSDGYPEELKPILDLTNTEFYNSINDMVDLYQMSKSKILITSAGSTYSYWAGFLGDSEVIQHPDHFCKLR